MRKSTKPKPAPAGGPRQMAADQDSKAPRPAARDVDALRRSVFRKLMDVLGGWRACPHRVCWRARACVMPGEYCVAKLPCDPTTPEDYGDWVLSEIKRQLQARQAAPENCQTGVGRIDPSQSRRPGRGR